MSLNWETDASLIPDWHRASPKYIYDLTYIHGQHGGNIDTGMISFGREDEGACWDAYLGIPIEKRIMDSFNNYRSSKKMQIIFDFNCDNRINDLIKKYGLGSLF